MTLAIAATADNVMEITERTTVIIKRFLSVLSFEAGVSTIWFILSTPGI